MGQDQVSGGVTDKYNVWSAEVDTAYGRAAKFHGIFWREGLQIVW